MCQCASASSQLLPYCACFPDENSNQSSVSDVYQLKVDSSTNSSPSPQQSESLSPAHTSDFRTDDSQPPTLGQEILEGESWRCPYAFVALVSLFCVLHNGSCFGVDNVCLLLAVSVLDPSMCCFI